MGAERWTARHFHEKNIEINKLVFPEDLLKQATDVLTNDGVIVHATEGVFGLACSAKSARAHDKISRLKGRDSRSQPYLVLVGDVVDVPQLVSVEVPKWEEILSTWPGPNTWIFPEKTDGYPWLGGEDGSLALRMPGDVQALELARIAGPLVSTSANRSGNPPCLSLEAARADFRTEVDFYLPGELVNPGHPSRVAHAISGDLVRA